MRFLLALQFLTMLPIKIKRTVKDEDLGRSLLYFPIIGLFIGLLLAGVAQISLFLPNTVSAVLILTVSIIITGGIHLDGFADTCDGFYGTRPKEERLSIMRDSRSGVMGIIGITMLLLLKFSLILSIPRYMLWKSLIMMSMMGRWALSYACSASTYARTDGKARGFIEHARLRDSLISGLFTLAIFTLLMGLKGLLFFGLSLGAVLLFIIYSKHKINGMTGDTLGAANEIAEAIILFIALIFSIL